MRKFAMTILRWCGWNIDTTTPEGVKKCVIVMGPHTSNWDFIIGKLAMYSYGINTKILIKKESFVFPLGYLLKAMGGLPVDRKKNNNITDQAVKYFDESESLYMIFTPEGTRSYNPNWKKGFYYISQKAKVPIYIGYLDYEKKIGGFYGEFKPTGDVEADIESIKGVLRQFKGKHPENGIR